MMHLGITADHGGLDLKMQLMTDLTAAGHEVVDFGAHELTPADDYPDFVFPLAQAVAAAEVNRGVAICGSGVRVCVAANKVPGVRAASISQSFSVHQRVDDDDINVMCLGGQVTGHAEAWELVQIYLKARFKGADRFTRRLAKIAEMESHGTK